MKWQVLWDNGNSGNAPLHPPFSSLVWLINNVQRSKRLTVNFKKLAGCAHLAGLLHFVGTARRTWSVTSEHILWLTLDFPHLIGWLQCWVWPHYRLRDGRISEERCLALMPQIWCTFLQVPKATRPHSWSRNTFLCTTQVPISSGFQLFRAWRKQKGALLEACHPNLHFLS